jgi:hypothetical protein
MTDTQAHSKPSKPTMKYLRDLAAATGRSFAWPKTQREAGEQIEALKKFQRTSRDDRHRETRTIRDDLARGRGGDAAVRDDELSGYGSNCSWLHQTQD